MDATTRLVAIIVLTSFATERILASIKYLLDLRDPTKDLRKDAPRTFLLFAIGAAITIAVVLLADIRVLRLVTPTVSDVVDFFVTWLIVFAGADLIRELLKGGETAPAPEAGKKKGPVTILIDHDGNVHLPEEK